MGNYADSKHGVKLNFSSTHANYYSALKYATKEDQEYLKSQDRANLKNVPLQTQVASEVHLGSGNKKGKKNSSETKAPFIGV